jgi:hypothetical protein
MIDAPTSGSSTEDVPTTDSDNAELKRVIEARVLMGYRVESLSETRAILVVNGRKRMFGLRGGDEKRTEVTINDQGRAITRNL